MERKQAHFQGNFAFDNGRALDFKLSLILFEENGVTISFCPALDISAYGSNEDEAMENLKIAIFEYFRYTVENKTLQADLLTHGWIIDEGKNATLSPPSMSWLMETNEELRRVVENVPYRSVPQIFNIPVRA